VNDFMAVGVLRELREQELRIPQDVSVEVQRNGEK
jgi:DNA-binding LacI/PurR family transcriptional regulator